MIKEYNYRNFNKVKFYYGIVNEVLEHYTVRFRIPDIIDNLDDDEYPIAHPILKHTSEIFKNDTIIIMQLDTDMQEFVYFSNDVTEFTGLRFGKDIIDLSLGKEEHPELHIKISQLKAKDKDDNDLDEGEEYTVLGPYSEITLTDTKIEVLKATPQDWNKATADGSDQDKKKALVTIESDSDAKNTQITATLFDDSDQGKEKFAFTATQDGEITVTTKPSDSVSVTRTIDKDGNVISESVPKNGTTSTITQNNDGEIVSESKLSETSKSTITQDKDGNFKLESAPNIAAKASVVTDSGDLKITAQQAPAASGSEIAMEGSTTTITADGGLKATVTIDGAQGINLKHDLGGEADIGALIEIKNMVGGLKGALDDLWTELSTVNQNMMTLASMTAAISYAGPGALINSTAGSIGGIAASIGTINAKKALVSATFK